MIHHFINLFKTSITYHIETSQLLVSVQYRILALNEIRILRISSVPQLKISAFQQDILVKKFLQSIMKSKIFSFLIFFFLYKTVLPQENCLNSLSFSAEETFKET